MYGGYQWGYAATTGWWGIGAIAIGTLILIALTVVFCTCGFGGGL